MAKDVGAKKVVVASCAPPIRSVILYFHDHKCSSPFRHSNVYGIDMPSRLELVAYGRDDKQIAQEIGADLVIFQSLPDLIWSVRQFNESLTNLDCSVFDGEYVTGGVDEAYLSHLEKLRADSEKQKLQTGPLGAMEGKGGGGVVNGIHESHEVPIGCSGPLNGADDTIGLYNHRR